MKITAQLSGVNRPLSVELRLMTFVPAIFDSQEENHTAPGQLLLTKRPDFRSAEGLVRCSPFGGDSYTINPMTAGPHFIVAFPGAGSIFLACRRHLKNASKSWKRRSLS